MHHSLSLISYVQTIQTFPIEDLLYHSLTSYIFLMFRRFRLFLKKFVFITFYHTHFLYSDNSDFSYRRRFRAFRPFRQFRLILLKAICITHCHTNISCSDDSDFSYRRLFASLSISHFLCSDDSDFSYRRRFRAFRQFRLFL